MEQPWQDLLAEARAIQARAYAPYSGYRVGAAARTNSGRVIVGCNVENSAYGVALCAECGLVSQLVATDAGRLTHFLCVGGVSGEIVMPCGRCRQLLWEHGGPGLLVHTPTGVKPMSAVLPDAFDATNLEDAE